MFQRVHIGAQNGNIYHEVNKNTDEWKKIEAEGTNTFNGVTFNIYDMLTKVGSFQFGCEFV